MTKTWRICGKGLNEKKVLANRNMSRKSTRLSVRTGTMCTAWQTNDHANERTLTKSMEINCITVYDPNSFIYFFSKVKSM